MLSSHLHVKSRPERATKGNWVGRDDFVAVTGSIGCYGSHVALTGKMPRARRYFPVDPVIERYIYVPVHFAKITLYVDL